MHHSGVQAPTHGAPLDTEIQIPEQITTSEPQSTATTPMANDIANVKNDNIVIIDRCGIIENKHHIHAAIVDSDGKLLYTIGDPARVTLLRSSLKPIQALAILETGAAERFDYDDADVALMCASHNSEPRHVARAQVMLEKTRIGEENLACGGHPSMSPDVNRGWIKEDFTPTRINNNCSGKHAGMIAGAICLGASVQDYNKLEHPMQQRVKTATEDLAGLSGDAIRWGVDGCNAAAPALPLRNFAMMYARLAEARDGRVEDESDSKSWKSSPRREHLARIHKSMSTYPEMVGGERRFCTTLMKAYGGALVGKVGADGCYGISLRASEDATVRDERMRRAIGIAVKVDDGNLDILYSVVPEILEQLDIGTKEMRHHVASFHHPPIVNSAQVVTGGITHCFRVAKIV